VSTEKCPHGYYCYHGPNDKKPAAMDKLKEAWNENPLMVMAVVGAALAGAGKFIDASGSIMSKWAYARRIKK
jgi:hypothetical protein